MLRELDSGTRCDDHIGEVFRVRCADCDALAEDARIEEAAARMLARRERPVTFRDMPWCGSCMPDTRLTLIDPDDYRQGCYRCPNCNPLAMSATAIATALIVAPINAPTESQERETPR